MKAAADRAGVKLVTGDTKVVDHGKADGLYINTAGIGRVRHRVGADRIQPGDAIIVNGDLGAHGVAILSTREGLQFESAIQSGSNETLHEGITTIYSYSADIQWEVDCAPMRTPKSRRQAAPASAESAASRITCGNALAPSQAPEAASSLASPRPSPSR